MVDDDVSGKDVVVVARLDRPDIRVLPVLYMAQTLRDMGARHLTLVSPYLPYMRQDARFHAGEALTSRYFAELLSAAWDEVITVDPHLHRIDTLDAIYRVPTRVVSSSSAVARYLAAHVSDVVLVGPDEESAQWVRAVAQILQRPWAVLTKVRHGDRDVRITVPEDFPREGTPWFLDDIISTGSTLIEAREALLGARVDVQHAIGIHGIFVDGAEEALSAAGFRTVVTTNTLAHATNGIDVLPELSRCLAEQRDAMTTT